MAVSQTKRLTAERWARLEEVFQAAAELGPDRSPAFLDAICGTDLPLRREVEALLEAGAAATGFLESAIRGALEELPALTGAVGQVEFTGTERFVLRRCLGSGGFGTVYEAYDREHDAVVALKTLLRTGGWEIHRLKREFRSLSGMAHRNLVSLYELLSAGPNWFFTMELVDGISFVDFVRNDNRCDFEKLRPALAQLAEGVRALHASGKLHRDLKPSNVLVTGEGRVVILDFGLVADDDWQQGQIAGTPPYMAPEQLEGSSLPASDWYAVGAILYKALTGRVPFGEDLRDVLRRQRAGLPPPSDFDPFIPEDLDLLCRQLLRRNPSERPANPGTARAVTSQPQASAPFVGRERPIGVLREALQRAESGESAVVAVHGPPGAGKTALVQHFFKEVRRERNAWTLSSRCTDQESVPYNAFDEIVDQLAGRLRRAVSPGIVDRDTALAARLFPVLEGLSPRLPAAAVDSPEVRQAALGSFRTLLARVAAMTPLVIHLEDLHWADVDSLQLLTEILRSQGIPRIMLILSFLSDACGGLSSLMQHAVTIELGPLSPAETRELASQLLPCEIPRYAETLAKVADDSGGNPLLLSELALHARSAGPEADFSGTLDQMLERRVADLPTTVRALLETVAVAGRPIEWPIVRRAAARAGTGEGAGEAELSILRAGRLIRTRRVEGRKAIEASHDRIREAARKRLPPEALARLHMRLAHELESGGRAGPDWLATHFHQGGDREKAYFYSIAAAEQASQALAFEAAIRHYQLALELKPETGANHGIRAKLAECLGNVGRGAESAALYLECAETGSSFEQVELRRCAAAQSLISGHIRPGLETLHDVLTVFGMKLPASARKALPSLLLHRAALGLFGLRFRERIGGPNARESARMDACWTVAQGLAMSDPIRAADFHARHLLMSLRAGDAYRISRALAIEAGYLAISGGKSGGKTERVLRMAGDLAGKCGNPHASGLVTLASGVVGFLTGRWKAAAQSLTDAETLLGQRCGGVAWELATARLMGCVSLFFLGEIKELAARCQALLENAEARGDLYESTDLKIRIAHVTHLSADQPGAGRREADGAIARWPEGEFLLPHWWALIAKTEIALYEGDAAGAWRLVRSQWKSLQQSLLLRVQYVRIESLFHRALAALALAARSTGERKRLVRIAVADASRIAREKTAWGDPLALIILAGAAAVDGNREAALQHLGPAEESFRAADMLLFAAIALRLSGQLTGGDAGRSMVEDADSWMTAQQIRNPLRMTGVLFPAGSLSEDDASRPVPEYGSAMHPR